MSTAEFGPQAARSSNSPGTSLWVKELPYGLVLILTILGIAYTSYLKQPIAGYWELLAPLIGLICVGAGWQSANDKDARLRLIWTQALHWLAFLAMMNVLFLPSVQGIINGSATSLAILSLLALGTFTAGVHVLSWQVCVLGLIMALGIPAIAWIEESALMALLITVVVLGIGAMLWWHWHQRRAHKADRPAGAG